MSRHGNGLRNAFRNWRHCDGVTAETGQQALKGYYPGLSDGIVHRRLDDYRRKQAVTEAMPLAMASVSLDVKDRSLFAPVKAKAGERSTIAH